MIDVLLATFNGAKYLPELLNSLERQTYRQWGLLVRDDGSTDGTTSLIEHWSQKQARPIKTLRGGEKLGACGSFAALLEVSDAPYFMFCDQDDVWLPQKMELLLRVVQAAEARTGAEAPVLAHSDLVVVDKELNQLHESFWRQQGTLPSSAGSNRGFIVQNRVTGCSLLGNAALRDLVTPIPKEAVMHDWWVALVAALAGQLVELDSPTVLYRQHGRNVMGAKGWRGVDLVNRFVDDPSGAIQRTRSVIRQTQRQAAVFASRFADRADAALIELCRDYSELSGKGFWERKTFPLRRGLWPANPLRAGITWWFL